MGNGMESVNQINEAPISRWRFSDYGPSEREMLEEAGLSEERIARLTTRVKGDPVSDYVGYPLIQIDILREEQQDEDWKNRSFIKKIGQSILHPLDKSKRK